MNKWNEKMKWKWNLSIEDKVNCLESSKYNKASDLFGSVPPPKKCLGGKTCCVNISINLVTKNNLLLRELESVGDLFKKSTIIGSFGKCEVTLKITL